MHLRLYGCLLDTIASIPWIPIEEFAQNPDGELHILGEAVPDEFLSSEWKAADASDFRAPYIDRLFRPCESGPAWMMRFRSPEKPSWAAFWFSADGRQLWIGWKSKYAPTDIACLLANSPSAAMLALHGHLCLHGAAVGVDDRAIVILGREGAGKSTTAATFFRCGHTALADDVGVLRRRATGFTAAAGMTALSLTSATAALFADHTLVPQWSRSGPWEEKWLLPLSETQPAELPLGAVVVLQTRQPHATAHAIRRLDPLAAQLQIAPHVQAQWLGTEVRRRNFQHLVDLVNSVPVYAAQAADDIARLPEFVDALTERVGRRTALPA
jgi:hypothetical protein